MTADPLLETAEIKALADDLTDRKSDVAAGLSAARMVAVAMERDHHRAEVAQLRLELGAVREERDLAVAHDRQPYPTADAYETACRALEKHRERADKAEAERDEARFQRDQECHGRKLNEFGLLAQLRDAQAERDSLAAQLAEAEKVVEAAKAWRDAHKRIDGEGDGAQRYIDAFAALSAAVEAYQPTPSTSISISEPLLILESRPIPIEYKHDQVLGDQVLVDQPKEGE